MQKKRQQIRSSRISRPSGPKEKSLEEIWRKCDKHGTLQDPTEFKRLLGLMRRMKIQSVLEIGCYNGGTAMGFLELGCRVVAIDKEHRPGIDVIKAKYPTTFTYINVPSTDTDTPGKVFDIASSFDATSHFDMLHIDGEHTAAASMKDYQDYKAFARKIIAFHDIKDNKVTRDQGFDVVSTWREVRAGKEWKEIINVKVLWCGYGVLIL